MDNWTKIPPELLQTIFKYHNVPISTLIECQSVCKSWCRSAQPILYSNVVLSKLDKTSTFVNTIISCPTNPGAFVKSIALDLIDNRMSRQIYLLDTIAKYCPNVECLDELCLVDQPVFLSLLQQIRDGYWQHLKTIPSPSDEIAIESYVDTVIALRDSIEKVLLQDHVSTELAGKGRLDQYLRLRRLLKDFKQLKTLTVRTRTRRGNMLELEDLFLDGVPSTVRSLFFNTFTVPMQQTEDFHPTLASIKPCYSVKHAAINTFIDNSHAIEYIMHKFPRLDCLTVDINPDDEIHGRVIISQSFSLRKDLFPRLVDYLQRLDRFDIQLNLNNMVEFAVYFLSTSTKYSSFHLEATYDDVYDEMCKGMSKIENNDAKDPLRIECSLDKNKMNESLSSFTEMLENVGAKLTSLTIRFPSWTDTQHWFMTRDDATWSNYLKGYFIDHVFKHCPNLKGLEVKGFNVLYMFYTEEMTINQTITHLVLDHPCIPVEVYKVLSLRLLALTSLKVVGGYPLSFENSNVIVIDMPYSSLKSFIYADKKVEEDFTCLCLKLIIDTNVSFYTCSHDLKMRRCTAQEFQELMASDSTDLRFDIRCKQFERFELHYVDVEWDMYQVIGSCQFPDELNM
ncbi:MAG: hypothetical protein EXX96DRAFT_580306 [Benjaminiella poitrasii]|nr:MAG: hypothetical protein EXX96DRAFT_580306 [Benjaminiella poitrasii]